MSRTQSNTDKRNSERNQPVDVALEIALEGAADPDVRFHIREALQFRHTDCSIDEATDQDVRQSLEDGDRR